MDESIPEEAEIEWDVKRLHYNRSRPLLGMWSEHLSQCLVEAREAEMETETADSSNWHKVVDLVQTAFW